MKAPASLGAKLVLILTGVGLIGAAALTLLLASVIIPSFNQLEGHVVRQQVVRTGAVLEGLSAKVESAAADYGNWDAAYDYMAKPGRAFEEESVSIPAMTGLDVNGMAFIGNDRGIVVARWFDIERQADMPAMRERLTRAMANVDFARTLGGKSSARFFLRLGNSLAAIGIAQVRRSDGGGTPRGYVLMARAVSAAQLSELLQIETAISLEDPAQAVTVTAGGGLSRIAVPTPGPDGRAVAAIAYTIPRELSTLGQRMLILAVVGSSLLLIVVLWVLRRTIARLVLKPLKRVERHMGVVRESGTISMLTDRPRNDEIGSLVTSFNSMLRQLKDLREQLEMQSFELGRSESAVAVMHNVRNALNPVSTVLSQGLGTGVDVDRGLLDKAVSELARDDIPPARRRKLAAFVAAALKAVEQEREARRQQLGIGREALHHVLEIIGHQQEAAHERPALEACNIVEIVAQNATIARYSGDTSIAFSFPSRPCWVTASRVLLSQVVGNLFSNAAEAIAATGRGHGSISVSIREQEGGVEISIRDDGEGFDPADASTLFQRGYSTRPDKSGGLGLHWCANSMLAMGGSLALYSDGKGAGACAVIALNTAPLAIEARDMAA